MLLEFNKLKTTVRTRTGSVLENLPPKRVSNPDSLAWDDVADVVVVGFGGAGACASLEARECGADVIAIDRFRGGGATAYSGGIIYAGATKFQKDAGFNDSPEQMYSYLSQEVGDIVQPRTLRRYCDESAANLDWLIAHGVPYASDAYLDKTIYPPDGKFLYYSGNEKVPEFAARSTPAPRGHRPVGTGMTGHVYYAALAQAANKAGVRLRTHEKVIRLVLDDSARVIGVETSRVPDPLRAEHEDLYAKVIPMLPFKAVSSERATAAARALEARGTDTRLIRARRGVVLATGGFAYNLEMMRQYQPFFAKNYRALMRLGSAGCDGSGIALGQSVGGATGLMDKVYAARNIAPPNALLDGILINDAGKRFVNEDAYSGLLGLAIAEQPQGRAWLILPAASFRRAIKQSLTSGMLFFKFYGVPALLNMFLGGTKRAGSLEGLARKCGVDAAGLLRTMEAYRLTVAPGRTDEFGRVGENRKPIRKGPFYAINMSIPNVYAFTYFFTLGGLLVDEDTGAVKAAAGQPIEGLYAAGRAAVGLCSNGYISGMSIGDGMFSGRRAGRACAAENAARANHAMADVGHGKISIMTPTYS
jgi:3-oxo-5alpha-steroid 4-dehydrogenase